MGEHQCNSVSAVKVGSTGSHLEGPLSHLRGQRGPKEVTLELNFEGRVGDS